MDDTPIFTHCPILQRIVLKCRPPSVEAVCRMNPEQLVISFIYPASDEGKVYTEPSAVWLDVVPHSIFELKCFGIHFFVFRF